jgi:membrane protein implicated in regulation of membrane protease activity
MQSENGRPHGSLGAAAKEVADHTKTLVKLELELATLEVKRKLTALGTGIALIVAAGIFGLLGLGFALATVAAAFATFLPTWLALLVMTFGVFALAGVLVLVGVRRIKKSAPPVPEQALREAKRTTERLKSDADAH